MKCKYCAEDPKPLIDKKISVLGLNTFLMLDLYHGHLELAGESKIIAKKEIQFCPMCGRKLDHATRRETP